MIKKISSKKERKSGVMLIKTPNLNFSFFFGFDLIEIDLFVV